ncbi:MAG: leucine-rich repeat domain-containing protein, partial [Ruminococcaceae bacterium]|nr:leucine-rich repeat domain-containing protein [Oscillospiraceae bacterium]
DLTSNDYAFTNAGKNSKGIKLIIGKNVTKIPSRLFRNTNIISVDFEKESVCKSIGEYAFFGCSSLTSITIPSSITSIGRYAFYNCIDLTEIYFNATAMNSLAVDNYVFSMAGQNKDGIRVVIGKNVIKIPVLLFCPDNPRNYKSSEVPKITSVEFEKGSVCESIEAYAFAKCKGLEIIRIPDTIKSIGSAAFYECEGIKEVHISDIASWCNISFGDIDANPLFSYYGYAKNLYLNENLITNLVIPNGVTSIPTSAFYCQSSLTSVTIPNSVTSIGDYAFSYCDNLTNVTIPDNVTSIGDSAFSYCDNLTNVYYEGTPEKWAEISIGSNNTYLTNATRYYYSEEEPTKEGNFWHYDENGNVIVW